MGTRHEAIDEPGDIYANSQRTSIETTRYPERPRRYGYSAIDFEKDVR